MKRQRREIDLQKRARLLAKVRAATSVGMGELGRQADEQLRREHQVLMQEASVATSARQQIESGVKGTRTYPRDPARTYSSR